MPKGSATKIRPFLVFETRNLGARCLNLALDELLPDDVRDELRSKKGVSATEY